MGMSEKIFVERKRSHAVNGLSYFEHKGEVYHCYTTCLSDVISLCLEPIKNYGFQVEFLSRDGGDCDDVGCVICALVGAAEARLEKFDKGFYKHIGWPGVIQTTYNNRGELPGDTVIGVSFRIWD